MPPSLQGIISTSPSHMPLAGGAWEVAVDAQRQVWPEMNHVWYWLLPMLDETRAAVEWIWVLIRSRTS